jgi:ectoine hydroxylase-related dioxygenase (phytanoyl-CoA dioxygenase family)
MTESFKEKIDKDGYAIVKDVLSAGEISSLKKSLLSAIDKEADWHGGKEYKGYGMVLLCSLYGEDFVNLFNNEKLIKPFEEILGEGCIVYAYTSSSMPPSEKNFSSRIHNDCPRVIPNYITNIGATILLDDFTKENGATWFVPKSQTSPEAPANFYEKAERVIAPAGSVFFFNACLWHAGGENLTKNWRHALTINMCRSFMKQRIDIPRAMVEIDKSKFSEKSLQKLGFHSQPPSSMKEYYLPLNERTFRQKVE